MLFKTAPSGVNADFSHRAGFRPPQRILQFSRWRAETRPTV
ncbi:hypothetical protein HMPREF9080_00364 [Cardiobacterium valvarum F0432]|uniref:Uncharacterized protein n=1 Tax=Cardiobacterium valvarum F0432 TaxID=797473 RepID=G9ZC82_9GAMM|nr:hypothetical protein HMPREF9080_00364 [Cardiobacterium valvarum F0432]